VKNNNFFVDKEYIISTVQKIIKTIETAGYCRKILPLRHPGFLQVLSKAMRLCRQRRFEPAEAFRLGLFHPDFDVCRLGDFVSRKEMTKIQKRLNPENSAQLTKNKGLFYARCLERGIPVPELYIVCDGRTCRWDIYQGGSLWNKQEKIEYLEKRLPDKFVIKPLYGSYGRDVKVYRRNETGFTDHFCKEYSSQELVGFIESAYHGGFVMQQKIENHPAIFKISGCEGLQTVRIITFVTDKGYIRVIHANFKPIIRRDVVIDNLIENLTGNVEVPVEIASGMLGCGNQIVSTGQGIVPIATHPVTGYSFAGFILPLWREALELVKAAAIQFLPLRTIGWDVALGPDRPCIIEGNVWWDPPNQHLSMNNIIRQIQDHLYENPLRSRNES
jgi:hypothetical protein